jgi:cytochrome c peroxidase
MHRAFSALPAAARRAGSVGARILPWVVVCAALGMALTRRAEPDAPPPGGQSARIGGEPITPIPEPPPADPSKVALGERLFADPRLSANGEHACTSCHDTRTNGADGAQRARDADGMGLSLNTPTIFNAALNFRLDWEGNFRTLESQAEASLLNPQTMGSTVDDVVRKLNADAGMAGRFQQAYGHRPDRDSLLDAIATYERSLLTPGSRFDRWLKGELDALSAEELNGYGLFKALGCVSCHQGANVGGNLFERNRIFRPPGADKSHSLRVPSLRNVAVTPPYFHDGRSATLAETVRYMGKAQLNETLTDRQTDEIVAFLNTLTGTYRGQPLTGRKP